MLTRITFCLVVLTTGCASHEPSERTSSDREVEPPPAAVLARASIASVQMIEDCPDPEPADEPPPPPAEPPADAMDEEAAPAARSRAMPMPGVAATPGEGGGHMPHSCTQSIMQIAFTGQGETPAQVAIKAIRVLDADSKQVVARIRARVPTAWQPDRSYVGWNETIAPKTDVKASYSLSIPEWSAVERKLDGKSSMGHMFVLEVDVDVGGRVQTIRSPEFPREEPHVIVT